VPRAAVCAWLAAALGFACGSGEDPLVSPVAPLQTGSAGSGGSAGASGASPDTTPPPGGASPGGSTGSSSGGSEGGPDPIGLAGSANEPTGASGAPAAGAGGTPSGGAGGGEQPLPDCDVPPAASPLVGWAATPGQDLDTTTGGGNAAPLVVTTLEELQAAAAGTAPAVIHVRGILTPGDLAIGSNKTIIGLCGAEVHGHVEIREAQNVIIRNLTIVGYSPGDCALDPGFDPAEGCSSGDDAITVQRNSHHIWFDHCAVRDGSDGNLDVSNGANFVTISWTKFFYTPRTDDLGSDATGASGHRYSNLVGGTDSPTTFDDANSLNVTWHHNWWADNVVERQPRIRFGFNHLFNNYYNSVTTNYCVRAGIQARILLEGNFFDGVDDPHEFNNAADETTANITADASNVYQNTTSDRSVGGGGPPAGVPPYDYADVLEDAAGIPAAVTSGAGPQ